MYECRSDNYYEARAFVMCIEGRAMWKGLLVGKKSQFGRNCMFAVDCEWVLAAISENRGKVSDNYLGPNFP
jgi:hypothetical protein